MNTATQLRGTCQLCGRNHAVKNGSLAKHGYTVTFGWFSGVCNGAEYLPLEQSRKQLDEVLAGVAEDIIKFTADIANLKSGKVTPKEAKSAPWHNAPMLPFAEAKECWQQEAVNQAIYQLESNIRQGKSYISNMTELADRTVGKELSVVAKPVAAERIQTGEKRTNDKGDVYTSTKVTSTRIYYTVTNERGTFTGWKGTRAWRGLKLVA